MKTKQRTINPSLRMQPRITDRLNGFDWVDGKMQNNRPTSSSLSAAVAAGRTIGTNGMDDTEKMVSLKEWTDTAINTIRMPSPTPGEINPLVGTGAPSWLGNDNKKSMAISSDAYLRPALKIAHSLADFICKADEDAASRVPNNGQNDSIRNANNSNNHRRRRAEVPTPSFDWAERVAICLSREFSASCQERDLQPLPFSKGKLYSEPTEMQAMINSVLSETSFLEEERAGDNSNGSTNNSFSYQNVKRVEFSRKNGRETTGDIDDEARRIYSLGLVFFELFSGGEQPPELVMKSNFQDPFINETIDENYDPLPTSFNGDSIDFRSALNIIGELGGNGGEFGSDLNALTATPMVEQTGRKKSRTHTSIAPKKQNMCIVSVEPLRMQKVPGPLCDLIQNMLECANGDFSRDETYQKMSDVRSDLKLMMEKPEQFLRELDFEKLSLTGLQLNETVFGREEEFSKLLSSYHRAISGGSEFAIISGSSGTGKSALACRLGRYAMENGGGIFLSGKFDQLKQSEPFSAVASAFNEYCDVMLSNGRGSRLSMVASKLRVALGQEAEHLVKVIPNLRNILIDEDGESYAYDEHDCVDARKRLEYLLCQFVAVISSSSSAPIILFLDDLQWADEASIEMIKHLLLISGASRQSKRFFFVGCCRGDEMSNDHHTWNMINSVKHFSVTATIIELSCMDQNAINEMVSNVLCLSPRLTRPLSDILYHKTKGNPLFFCQLMLSLNKEGLLNLSLSRRRWEWEEEKIQSRKLPENVALFFTSTISKLPKEVQSALCVVSCFGASAKVSLIETLEQSIHMPLMRSLDDAVSEGLLSKSDGRYSFLHDRIQEAAYNMMKPEERCLYHFQYGIALCSDTLVDGSNDIIFTAVDQINHGGPSAVTEPSQNVTIANLNLVAGQKAIGMSDFRSAFGFFDNGINFLKKNHWKDHYDLSLQLFDGAAKCSFFIGDNVALKLLSEQILTFAGTFQDKLNVLYITVSALSYASKLPESIDKATAILSQLGEHIPESLSDADADIHIAHTKSMLNQIPDNELLNYNRMNDQSKIMAMKFLARMETPFQMTRPSLQPIVTIRKVQLSITHGMSPVSPVGFAHFGALLARRGEIAEGYRYVKIAKNLLRTIGSKDVAGEVICVSTHVMCFVEPVQSTNEFYREGHTAAMTSGDMINAMLNSVFYSVGTFWTGAALPLVKKNLEVTRRLLEQQNHLTFLSQILPMTRSLSRLIGTDNPEGAIPSIDESKMEETLRQKNPYQAMTLTFQKLYIAFIFREYDVVKSLAEKYFQFPFKSRTLIFVTSVRTFICGLASFWIYRQTGDIAWAERGNQAKQLLGVWCGSSQWNFSSKFHLLEAEEFYSNNDFESAKISYNKAIFSSRQHKFVNEEALACELAGYFHLAIGDGNNAVDYFTQSHEKYHDWGAFAKTSKLYEFAQAEFGFVQRVLTPSTLSLNQNTQFDIMDTAMRKRVSYNT